MKEFQEEEGQIVIYGAREHNLKNIDLTIPRNSQIYIFQIMLTCTVNDNLSLFFLKFFHFFNPYK